MMFSKSFGYALRGILYVAVLADENRKIRITEIADNLTVPRHFLGKIMNRVAKKGILHSAKGPNGGFSLNEQSLGTTLLTLMEAIDGHEQFDTCAMGLTSCHAGNLCPIDNRIDETKRELRRLYAETKIGSLLKENKHEFIRSISI